jgi:hypothetical protein
MTATTLAPLTLQTVNADVFGVYAANRLHVGNLKRIGPVWKFKAIGYDAAGGVEPGGGPLTDRHNMTFTTADTADMAGVSHRLTSPPHS